MNKDDQNTLKGFIERFGVFDTLNTLSGICGRKAEHFQSNWDYGVKDAKAKEWEKAEAAIDKAASEVLDLELPTGIAL